MGARQHLPAQHIAEQVMLVFLGRRNAAGLIAQVARNAWRYSSPAVTLCGRNVVARGGLVPHVARLVAFASLTVNIIRIVFLTAACCRSKRDEVLRSRGIVQAITYYFKMTF